MLIGTLNGKNSVNYTRSAGKANTLLKVVKDIGVPQRLLRKTSLIKTEQELTF